MHYTALLGFAKAVTDEDPLALYQLTGGYGVALDRIYTCLVTLGKNDCCAAVACHFTWAV